MKAGNIINFPKATSFSDRISCTGLSTDSKTKVSFKGQVWVSVDKHYRPTQQANFTADFTIMDEQRVEFEVKTPDGRAPNTNFMALKYVSDPDEEIYGMGLQYSEWNMKGKKIPLITAEAGVGRGVQPITAYENEDGGQGGNTVLSYAPAASYITNKQRGLIFNPNNIGYADFTEETTATLLYWHATAIGGTVLSAPTPIRLAQLVSTTVGLMKPLPEWLAKGCIIGIVGGQTFVD